MALRTGVLLIILVAGIAFTAPVAAESYGDRLSVSTSFKYSSMIISRGGVDYLDVEVSSNHSNPVYLETELDSVDATFVENGLDSISYQIPPGGNRSFRVKVSPQVSGSGSYSLDVITRDLNTSIEKELNMPVYVRETPNTQALELPGIPNLAVFYIIVLASMLFIFRENYH